MVNSKDPELTLPFNLPMVTYQLGTNGGATGQQRVLGYLVDTSGDIGQVACRRHDPERAD